MIEYGKHASFIWSAYGITFLLLLGLIFITFQKSFALRKQQRLLNQSQKITDLLEETQDDRKA